MEVLGDQLCAEWNGYLGGMWNILELVNLSNQVVSSHLTLYSSAGVAVGSGDVSVSAGGQQDVLIHDWAGRKLNEYGKVCVQHDGGDGALDGRMVYYKGSTLSQFQFAFAMPFSNGKAGAQFVSFNTLQPSTRTLDKNNSVANWIQITNLSDSQGVGTLIYYDGAGNVLGQDSVNLLPGARYDYSAHRFGKNIFGMVEWLPNDPSLKFELRNSRYLYNNGSGYDSFDTAFQLEGMYGTGELMTVPLNTDKSSAILEVANVTAQTQSVIVRIYNQNGQQLAPLLFNLAPHASRHVVADSFLGPNAQGTATIQGFSPSSIMATAMEYGRNTKGQVEFMYGVPALQGLGIVMRGSANTFISQRSDLVLVNPTAQTQVVQISMTRSDGTPRLTGSMVSLPAHGSRIVNLNAYEVADKYDVVTVQPENPNSVVSWVLRKRNRDYVIPVPVR